MSNAIERERCIATASDRNKCNSMWQQSGRAGRREKAALSVYVAFGGPLDQHFMKAPQKLFMKPIEHAQVDASNEQVVEQHLACAALEHPLNVTHDEAYLGSRMQSAIVQLVKQGQLGRHPSNSQETTGITLASRYTDDANLS